jgi:hypothetical protein
MAPRKKKIEALTDGGTVVGLFGDQPSAERAIQSLKAAGFSEQQIGVAVRDRTQQEAMTEATGTQAAEGAATGAMSGGVVGGVIGLLAGVGALAIPGIGPIIAGGALASTLAGAGIGAAAGGLLGALVGMGIPEEDARHFERGFQEGGVLVTVQAGSRSTEARQILYDREADLGSMGRGLTTGVAGKNNLRSGQRDLAKPDETPVVREEIEVRKRRIENTEQVSDTVRREEARIESQGDGHVDETRAADSETWRGSERRYHDDQNYPGPNRRMAER